MDTLTVAERSERMARIRSKDTKPEMVVRRSVHQLGYRYRLHRRDLPGVPDLVFPSRKKIIFVHGCFWHAHARCTVANRPKSRKSFWLAKFRRNKERDRANEELLRRAGWGVLVIWECETKDKASLMRRLSEWLATARALGTKEGKRYGRR